MWKFCLKCMFLISVIFGLICYIFDSYVYKGAQIDIILANLASYAMKTNLVGYLVTGRPSSNPAVDILHFCLHWKQFGHFLFSLYPLSVFSVICVICKKYCIKFFVAFQRIWCGNLIKLMPFFVKFKFVEKTVYHYWTVHCLLFSWNRAKPPGADRDS